MPPHRKPLVVQRPQENNAFMTLTTITLLATTSLCLAFPETRWMGVVAIVVLGYLYPLSLLIAFTLIVVALCTFHYL
jgi:hypothetical protein